jgi:hypothetical protein
MIVNVTEDLRTEILATEVFLKNIEGERVTDRTHFKLIAKQLESYVIAVLSAPGSISLLGEKPAGPKLAMDAQSGLLARANDLANYLSHRAAGLLSQGEANLSTYARDLADEALTHLRGLHAMVTNLIRRGAVDDLKAIADRGPKQLLEAAAILAHGASTGFGNAEYKATATSGYDQGNHG